MSKRPIERVSFVVERWPSGLQVKGVLYEGEQVLAVSRATVALTVEQAEFVRVTELMDTLRYLVGRCQALRSQPPLPW